MINITKLPFILAILFSIGSIGSLASCGSDSDSAKANAELNIERTERDGI